MIRAICSLSGLEMTHVPYRGSAPLPAGLEAAFRGVPESLAWAAVRAQREAVPCSGARAE